MSDSQDPIEIVKEARDAAQEVIEDSDLRVGFTLIITIPPGYDSVRFATNLGNEGAASLMRETAKRLEQQTNGGNIETP